MNQTTDNNKATSNIVYFRKYIETSVANGDCKFTVVQTEQDLATILNPVVNNIAVIWNKLNTAPNYTPSIAIYFGGVWLVKILAGANGSDGKDGLAGSNGKDGVSIKGDKGETGITGLAPEHLWVGTQLKFRLPNGTWGVLIDLKGEKGVAGDNGNTGAKGDMPNHLWEGTFLKFQIPAGGWGTATNLKGDKGDNGGNGNDGAVGLAPEHRWVNTQLQFKLPNGVWGVLVDLRGNKGDKGEKGDTGAIGGIREINNKAGDVNGSVVLTTDDIQETLTATNKWFTPERAVSSTVTNILSELEVVKAPNSSVVYLELAGKEATENKGVPNGYVPLNSAGVIDPLYLPITEWVHWAGYTKVGNLVTLLAGSVWKYQGIIYSNLSNVPFTIPLATVDHSRFDVFAGTKTNTFVIERGMESLDSPVKPTAPANTVEATFILVSDSVVGEVPNPASEADFVREQESWDQHIDYYNPVVEEVLLVDQRSSVSFQGSNTDIKSFKLNQEFMRLGKIFTLKNRQLIPVTLWHNSGTGNLKMFFPKGENLVLKPKEIIQFSLNLNDSSTPRLEYVGIFLDITLIQNQINAINILLQSDNINLDNVQELVDAIENIQLSLSSILVNDLTTGGVSKALTAEMGKTLKGLIDLLVIAISAKEDNANKTGDIAVNVTSIVKFPTVKGIVDWVIAGFKSWYENVIIDAGISRTVALTDLGKRIIFTNGNPIAFTLPTNATVPLAIGFSFNVTQQGVGLVTAGGSGINFISDSGLVSSQGETRKYVKVDIDTWSIEGNKSFNNTTFTGTTNLPATTSIGSITATILGYLSGITSNVQTQLDSKLTSFGTGTNNYIQKVTGVNIFGNSRLFDNGVALGIDTVRSPTKDITLGRQSNKNIGVEQSDSNTAGKNLKIEAGRTINFQEVTTLSPLNRTELNWLGSLCGSGPDGSIYVSIGYGPICKSFGNQTDSFNPVVAGVGNGEWLGITITANNDLYATFNPTGKIYKQTNSAGSAIALVEPVRNWFGMASTSNGNVYASEKGGDIYMQTGSSGSFIPLNQGIKSWGAMCVNRLNNDVYAVVESGDIYKQSGGLGNFIALGQVSRNWTGIDVAPNGDVWAVVLRGDVYKSISGGSFIGTGQVPKSWAGIAINQINGNVFVAQSNIGTGEVWFLNTQSLGTPNLDGGILQQVSGTGKGTGKSWWQVWTGQKTVSGTDMQVETLRVQVDEVGLMTLPSTTPAIISADPTGKAVVTKEYLGTLGNSNADMVLGTSQTVFGLKTFLNGMFGLRNVANNITSFFTNTNTVARTYTLQDRDGTFADLTDIAGVNSGKMNTPAGTQNFLSKFLTASTIGLSRLRDTGTFFGIGTINAPTKDITLGNQLNREIGIEESANTNIGRTLTIKAGRAINYVPNVNFNRMFEANRLWFCISGNTSGDVYAGVHNGDIYKATAGGTFNALGFLGNWRGITCAPNGDVYASSYEGDIYKQTNSVGNFVALGQVSRNWRCMASAPNGNIYAGTFGGDLYMQTGGLGNFVALGQTIRNWTGITVRENGDVFACAQYESIYIQTAGTGSFISLGVEARGYTGITAINNNIYTCVEGGGIYIQTGGSGAFVSYVQEGLTTINWMTIGSTPLGNIYIAQYAGDIYFQNNDVVGTANLDGGTLKQIAGTGKGMGKSRWEAWTGQKKPSGTDMQIETLRAVIDEEGLMTLPSTTIAIISADTSGKAVVTKEYLAVTQITITTAVNITTDTTSSIADGSHPQKGKNVIIDNGATAINVVVNGSVGFSASYMKFGSGAITFLAGSGRTLVTVDATAVLNGTIGSTATITSVGTIDYLRISNAS